MSNSDGLLRECRKIPYYICNVPGSGGLTITVMRQKSSVFTTALNAKNNNLNEKKNGCQARAQCASWIEMYAVRMIDYSLVVQLSFSCLGMGIGFLCKHVFNVKVALYATGDGTQDMKVYNLIFFLQNVYVMRKCLSANKLIKSASLFLFNMCFTN